MKTKSTAVRLVGAAMVAAALVPWIGGGSAAATVNKATADIFVKDEQVPVKAADFANQQTDCPGFVVGGNKDVWHFVLDGNNYDFAELTAEFLGGTTVSVTPGDKHAYVTSPAGLTLVDAYADLTGGVGAVPADFQLSHVCTGVPTPPTTSSAPVTSSSAPVVKSSSAPASVLPSKATTKATTEVKGVKNRKPPAVLPHTGSGMSLGMALTVSFGLLLGGAALMFAPRGLTVQGTKGKRRRH